MGSLSPPLRDTEIRHSAGMSGAEIIGVISGVIATIDAVTKLSSAIKDSNGLPTAFRDVHKRLPLVTLILNELGRAERSAHLHDEAWMAMSPTLDSCRDKAERLELIFNQILPQPVDLRLDRYWKAVRALGKGDTVESLMEGILADCQLLIGFTSIKKNIPREHVAELKGALHKFSTTSPSDEDSLNDGIHYNSSFNTGSGTQYIYSGIGTQVNHLGNGAQYNGPVTQYF